MKKRILLFVIILFWMCKSPQKPVHIKIFETSAAGNQLEELLPSNDSIKVDLELKIDSTKTFQTITGIGGAFTESSAYLLTKLSSKKRQEILNAYFSREGANYSLARTHMNSCDFSLGQYSYAPVADDMQLENFSVKEDSADLIPMIKGAMQVSQDGFKLFASPWTAPPWMKDNKEWVGGKLLPKYYPVWAKFFSKYKEAYEKQGIPIWGFTVENEPHGNGSNWESMHFTPQEMSDFVVNHLSPQLNEDGQADAVILGYDQNRLELKEWVDEMYKDEETAKHFDGTAIHWYDSTYDYFPKELQYAHEKAPDKYLIQTEGCVDSEVPRWKDDAWYWKKEATDWGWDWAPAEQKHLHPKYVPSFRYARDLIGSLNNWVDGWVDWNMVLDKQGGPNWFKNWCVAPIIVDPDKDEVYYTPLYYIMVHFSKYIRPGAKVIHSHINDQELMQVAVRNPHGALSVIIFNPTEKAQNIALALNEKQVTTTKIDAKAIQTLQITP